MNSIIDTITSHHFATGWFVYTISGSCGTGLNDLKYCYNPYICNTPIANFVDIPYEIIDQYESWARDSNVTVRWKINVAPPYESLTSSIIENQNRITSLDTTNAYFERLKRMLYPIDNDVKVP